jgi:RND superfamily putative drug exporter
MLDRQGRFCARHHWPVIGVWVLIVIAAVVLAKAAGGDESNSFTLPGTEAQRAANQLADNFPEQNGAKAQIAFKAKNGTIEDQATEINKALAAVAKLKHIVPDTGVSSPFFPPDDTGCTMNLGEANENAFCTVSNDGTIAYSNVSYTKSTSDVGLEGADDLEDAIDPFRSADLEIQVGGSLVVNTEPVDTGASEEIGIVAAIIVLLITLGAVAAMGIPIISAIVGVGIGVALITLLANVFTVPSVAPAAAIMIGLGVGIDYSLFVVGRFKSELANGLDVEAAAGKTLATSGRAVLTAGSTVIVALLGLAVFQVPAVSVIALSIGVVVVVSIAAALTLLPALCGLLGRHVEWGRLHFIHALPREGHEGNGRRWIGWVTRVPWASALLAVLALVIIAIPSARMRLGPSDATDSPSGSTELRTYNLITDGFGPGFNNAFLGVVKVGGGKSASDTDVLQSYQDTLADIEKTSDVALVSPPSESLASDSPLQSTLVTSTFNKAENTGIFTIVPNSGAKSERTPELVDRLRDDTLPKATSGTDLDVLVGGTSASYVDLDDRIEDRLFLFIAVVILISFVILGTVFRSVMIPITAAIFNLLAIFAAYGVLVFVFQWGTGLGLIGVDQHTPIVSYLAPVIFAVLFGLSMDYEVYTVSRAKEEYDLTGDPTQAVHEGIGSAARMVVAAASIMFFVFFAFVLSPSIIMKMFGLGLAVAILIDALIIRMTLLPSVLKMLGHAAWWPGKRRATREQARPAPAAGGSPAPEPAG